jgi:hypothetical protein
VCLDSQPLYGMNDRLGEAQRPRRAVEGGQEAVAGAVDLAAAEPGQFLADQPVVLGHQVRPSVNYPDVPVSRYVKPAAQAIVRATAARCLAEPEVFVSIGTALAAGGIFAVTPSSGPLGTRLTENSPTQKIQAPVLLAQGDADPLVIPAAQAAYVKTECGTGTTIDYRAYPGLDRLSFVAATSPLIPELISWTQDRFDGQPAPSTC